MLTTSMRLYKSLYRQLETGRFKGNLEYEFAGVYADQGISGYCGNRPQFQEMLERANLILSLQNPYRGKVIGRGTILGNTEIPNHE